MIKINYEKLNKDIVNWLINYAKSAKSDGFVIGVSGGVDSGVCSALCAQTGLKVIALTMPIHQIEHQINNADTQITWLLDNYDNVEHINIDLSTSFDNMNNNINLPNMSHNLVGANTRSRLRMTTLYAYATHHNLLVCGTGNKVEDFGVGFFTKYGDGGVDISPIADLMKSEVRELSRFIALPPDVINAPPTDGLWPNGDTDEDQIGATYDELEWAMGYMKNNPYYTSDDLLTLKNREIEVLRIYNMFNTKNKHKILPIPIFISAKFE